MKCTVHLQPHREEVIIYARESGPLIEEICRLAESDACVLIGTQQDQQRTLSPVSVLCFITQNGKTEAITYDGTWRVKQRLYQLEDALGDAFIKINQSCLVNPHAIERFKTTFGGSLQVVLKNGYTEIISRRQVKAVKERMGL